MSFHGSEAYEDTDFLSTYLSKRHQPQSPNNILEKPVIDELLPLVSGASVLDLGCGDGTFGQELLEHGAAYYQGIDGSGKMIQFAQEKLASFSSQVKLVKGDIQHIDLPSETFDLVMSRLVLHYLDDLETIAQNIFRTLVPGGHFIFSIEHPVITSCYTSYNSGEKRGDWIVDNYFNSGERVNIWNKKEVIKFHRSLEEYIHIFQSAGLSLINLRESKPQKDLFMQEKEYHRRMRIPLFLICKWKKET